MNNKVEQLINNIERSIIGKRPVIEKVVCAMLAGGHVLIEDVPGVGKTLLAETLAKSVSGSFGRIQFTPDLMPSDVIGYTVVDINTGKGSYKPGAAMCNFLLADEINRASPKVQSSVLEAMEELQISVDGETHQLPKPFMTLATQNPIETFGTYHLPEAQLDRFMIKISMGYPTVEEETGILLDRLGENPANEVRPVMTAEQLSACIAEVQQVNFAESLCRYVAELSAATRAHGGVELGVSPRASLAIMQASRAYAYLDGRDYVVPEDIVRLMIPVFSHRIVLRQEMKMRRMDVTTVLQDAVSAVTPPVRRSL